MGHMTCLTPQNAFANVWDNQNKALFFTNTLDAIVKKPTSIDQTVGRMYRL